MYTYIRIPSDLFEEGGKRGAEGVTTRRKEKKRKEGELA
jgi:hypothetical protein